jgi:N-acyl-D-aspartate/D-glutamate deacylase
VGHVQVRVGEEKVAKGKAVDADVLLKGGTIFDGGEGDGVVGDVAIRGGRIVAVGRFETGKATRVVDCAGLVVAPGFIDAHTHSDDTVLDAKVRPCLSYLLQGCTTMVTGNCGGGPRDVAKFLGAIDRQGAGMNVVHLLPHGAVRSAAMGNARREPTPAELTRMKGLVAQGMREGAFGMSTGLIYPPSSYAKTAELIELAKVVADHGGVYVSHIRGEGKGLLKSVGEAIEIGRRARVPVQISHFKASGIPNWGRIRDAAAMIEQARREGVRVTADQYPYAASSTGLESTVLPDDAIPGGRRDLAKRMSQDPKLAKQVRTLVQQQLKTSTKIVIASCKKHPEYVGKSIQQIAADQKADQADVAIKIALESGPQVVNYGMSEEDVRWAMALPWVATGSDGSVNIPRPDACPHPRNFGTFARKIGFCAIEQKWIPLGQAIRSCSGLPADIFGLTGRGYLRPGYIADVVVFDPKTFRDRATFEKPQVFATGVQYVFVAGKPAIDAGKPTNALNGRAIRHESK